jgi:TRAP-type C4-dicarboxylate transport system permease small subunit
LVVFATFCFGPVFLQGEHIRVDLFTRHLPNTVQQVLWLISESLFLVFTVLIIYSSFDLISHSIEVNSRLEVSEIPLTPFLLCLPVGLGFLGLVLLVDLCDRLYALFTGVRS